MSSMVRFIIFLNSFQELFDVNDPVAVASFLLNTPGLDRKEIGEFIGDDRYLSVLESYCNLFSFAGLNLNQALRAFLGEFFLPPLPQKIERILERFSIAFVRQGEEGSGSERSITHNLTKDQCYEIANMLVIANTTLHSQNPLVRSQFSRESLLKILKDIVGGRGPSLAELERWLGNIAQTELRPQYQVSDKLYSRLAKDPRIVRQMLEGPPVDTKGLKEGGLFLKYCRSGRAVQRKVWLDEDEKYILWANALLIKGNISVKDSTPPRKLPLEHLTDIEIGAASSPLFSIHGAMPVERDQRSFTLTFHIPLNDSLELSSGGSDKPKASKHNNSSRPIARSTTGTRPRAEDGLTSVSAVSTANSGERGMSLSFNMDEELETEERTLCLCLPEDHFSARLKDWVIFFYKRMQKTSGPRRLKVVSNPLIDFVARLNAVNMDREVKNQASTKQLAKISSYWPENWITIDPSGNDSVVKPSLLGRIFKCGSSSSASSSSSTSIHRNLAIEKRGAELGDKTSLNRIRRNKDGKLESVAFYDWKGVLDRGFRLETTVNFDLVKLWTDGLPPAYRPRMWSIALSNGGIYGSIYNQRQMLALAAIGMSIRVRFFPNQPSTTGSGAAYQHVVTNTTAATLAREEFAHLQPQSSQYAGANRFNINNNISIGNLQQNPHATPPFSNMKSGRVPVSQFAKTNNSTSLMTAQQQQQQQFAGGYIPRESSLSSENVNNSQTQFSPQIPVNSSILNINNRSLASSATSQNGGVISAPAGVLVSDNPSNASPESTEAQLAEKLHQLDSDIGAMATPNARQTETVASLIALTGSFKRRKGNLIAGGSDLIWEVILGLKLGDGTRGESLHYICRGEIIRMLEDLRDEIQNERDAQSGNNNNNNKNNNMKNGVNQAFNNENDDNNNNNTNSNNYNALVSTGAGAENGSGEPRNSDNSNNTLGTTIELNRPTSDPLPIHHVNFGPNDHNHQTVLSFPPIAEPNTTIFHGSNHPTVFPSMNDLSSGLSNGGGGGGIPHTSSGINISSLLHQQHHLDVPNDDVSTRFPCSDDFSAPRIAFAVNQAISNKNPHSSTYNPHNYPPDSSASHFHSPSAAHPFIPPSRPLQPPFPRDSPLPLPNSFAANSISPYFPAQQNAYQQVSFNSVTTEHILEPTANVMQQQQQTITSSKNSMQHLSLPHGLPSSIPSANQRTHRPRASVALSAAAVSAAVGMHAAGYLSRQTGTGTSSNDSDASETVSEAVRTLLTALFVSRPDVNYTRQLIPVCALLVFHSPTYNDAWVMLNSLVNRPLLSEILSGSHSTKDLSLKKKYFEEQFSLQLPQLHAHFVGLHLTVDTYLMPWVLSLFTNVVPPPTLCVLWDQIVLLGDPGILQIALGILRYLEPSLLGSAFAGCIKLLYRMHAEIAVDEDAFMSCVEASYIPAKSYASWLAKRRITSVQSAQLLEIVLLEGLH